MKKQLQFENTVQTLSTFDSYELKFALIESIQHYTESLYMGKYIVSENDNNNIYVITSLLEALIKDTNI